mmetsp:Transcript_26973/g.60935  ORF Transcript_26973/g.60935 Transcript_26973/m.60935 type:complete len:216 (+) Transcript_26973:414-1061(+)
MQLGSMSRTLLSMQMRWCTRDMTTQTFSSRSTGSKYLSCSKSVGLRWATHASLTGSSARTRALRSPGTCVYGEGASTQPHGLVIFKGRQASSRAPPNNSISMLHVAGEGEDSLPTPSADSDAHFSSSVRGGGGSRPPLGGAFRPVEGNDGAVAVRRRHGQAVRGTRRYPSRFADSQTARGTSPPKPWSAARVEAPGAKRGRVSTVRACDASADVA